jgi:hypothetical protein
VLSVRRLDPPGTWVEEIIPGAEVSHYSLQPQTYSLAIYEHDLSGLGLFEYI